MLSFLDHLVCLVPMILKQFAVCSCTSSASASAKSSDVWQYFGPLYCEYRTRLKFIGRKSLSYSRLVLFLVKVHFRCVNYLAGPMDRNTNL